MTASQSLTSAADLDASTVRQVSAGAVVSINPALASTVQAHCDGHGQPSAAARRSTA